MVNFCFAGWHILPMSSKGLFQASFRAWDRDMAEHWRVWLQRKMCMFERLRLYHSENIHLWNFTTLWLILLRHLIMKQTGQLVQFIFHFWAKSPLTGNILSGGALIFDVQASLVCLLPQSSTPPIISTYVGCCVKSWKAPLGMSGMFNSQSRKKENIFPVIQGKKVTGASHSWWLHSRCCLVIVATLSSQQLSPPAADSFDLHAKKCAETLGKSLRLTCRSSV